MRYHNITKDDMLNGDGLRVVLWVAGCSHACKECHNPITWDPNGGLPFDESAKQEIFDELEKYGDIYSDEFFDSLLLDKDLDDFKRILDKMHLGLARRLATRAHVLFKDKEFDSGNKMNLIQDKIGVEDLFATM